MTKEIFMKTAEVILENEWNKNKNNYPFNEIYIGEKIAINNAMIEFAKYHVQKALKQASKKAFVEYIDLNTDETFDYTDVITDDDVEVNINKESILNAYSLENIK